MPQNECLNDDKNYHLQMEHLEKERIRLGKRLNELRQKEKAIQSSMQNKGQDNALKNMREKISAMEIDYVEGIRELRHMKETYQKEVYRREHCPIPSNKCPICPIHPPSKPGNHARITPDRENTR